MVPNHITQAWNPEQSCTGFAESESPATLCAQQLQGHSGSQQYCHPVLRHFASLGELFKCFWTLKQKVKDIELHQRHEDL